MQLTTSVLPPNVLRVGLDVTRYIVGPAGARSKRRLQVWHRHLTCDLPRRVERRSRRDAGARASRGSAAMLRVQSWLRKTAIGGGRVGVAGGAPRMSSRAESRPRGHETAQHRPARMAGSPSLGATSAIAARSPFPFARSLRDSVPCPASPAPPHARRMLTHATRRVAHQRARRGDPGQRADLHGRLREEGERAAGGDEGGRSSTCTVCSLRWSGMARLGGATRSCNPHIRSRRTSGRWS